MRSGRQLFPSPRAPRRRCVLDDRDSHRHARGQLRRSTRRDRRPATAQRSWKVCVRGGRFSSARKKVSTKMAARTLPHITVRPDMSGSHTRGAAGRRRRTEIAVSIAEGRHRNFALHWRNAWQRVAGFVADFALIAAIIPLIMALTDTPSTRHISAPRGHLMLKIEIYGFTKVS